MNNVLAARTNIYDWFQSSPSMQRHFTQTAQADAYAAYYTSMYLIQDTAESVSSICSAGFSPDASRAYIELWGTLQALIIQQDAINELNKAITGQLPRSLPAAWQEIRSLRNEIAGHPVAQGSGSQPKRSFVGRAFGSLNKISYEQSQSASKSGGSVANTQHLSVDLHALVDRHDTEAATALGCVLAHMKKHWP